MDKEAALKYFEIQVTDSEWRKIVKSSFETCITEVEPHLEEMQKRSNFTRAECNIKYDALNECVELESFEVRFEV